MIILVAARNPLPWVSLHSSLLVNFNVLYVNYPTPEYLEPSDFTLSLNRFSIPRKCILSVR